MLTKRQSILLAGIIIIGYWATLRTRPLQFQNVTDGGRVEGTEYIYQIEEVEHTNPDGKKFTGAELHLLNTSSGERFKVPRLFPEGPIFRRQSYYDFEADVWRESQELSCPGCIAVVSSENSAYLIADRDGSGSAAYRFSTIIRIENDTAIEEMRHLSCGRPRIRRDQIILSNLEPDCPDWLWGPRWMPRWQITRFKLD